MLARRLNCVAVAYDEALVIIGQSTQKTVAYDEDHRTVHTLQYYYTQKSVAFEDHYTTTTCAVPLLARKGAYHLLPP